MAASGDELVAVSTEVELQCQVERLRQDRLVPGELPLNQFQPGFVSSTPASMSVAVPRIVKLPGRMRQNFMPMVLVYSTGTFGDAVQSP